MDWFYIVLMVLLGIYLIVDYVLMRRENFKDFYLHGFNYVDKWILLLDKSHLIRIKGDFYLSHSPKEDFPYGLHCGTALIGRYETEDDGRAMLVELTKFLNDETWHVYTMP